MNESRLECGITLEQNSKERLFKLSILDSVKDLDKKTIRAEARGADGSAFTPTVSPKGCLVVPDNVSNLKVSAVIDGESYGLAEPLLQSGGSSVIGELKLKAVKEPLIAVGCPAEGIFGKDFIENPFRVAADGNDEVVALQVLARSFSTQVSVPLLEKKFGLKFDDNFEKIDIRSLKPGSYQLEVSQANIGAALSESFNLSSHVKACVLTKVDELPKFKQLNDKALFAKGEVVAARKPGISYQYCRIESKSKLSQACDVQPSCLGEMKVADEIMAEGSGFYRYFASITDKSGQKSAMLCQDLIVSEEAPAVTIQWANPKYSVPVAGLEKPFSSIKLKIRTSHPQFGENSSRTKVMCQATFSKGVELEITGDSLKCLSKECKGMALGKPVPCGEELDLDLKGAWDLFELWDSILKVTATADDGLGHISTSTAKVIFPTSAIGIREYRNGDDFMMSGDLFDGDGYTSFVSGIKKDKAVIRVFQGATYFDILPPTLKSGWPLAAVKTGKGTFQTLWEGEGGCHLAIHKIAESEIATSVSNNSQDYCHPKHIFTTSDNHSWLIQCMDNSLNVLEFDGLKLLRKMQIPMDPEMRCAGDLIVRENGHSLLLENKERKIFWSINGEGWELSSEPSQDFFEIETSHFSDPIDRNSRVTCMEKGWMLDLGGQNEVLYFPRLALIAKKDHVANNILRSESCPNIISTQHSILFGKQELVQLLGSDRIELTGNLVPQIGVSIEFFFLLDDEPQYYFEDGFSLFHDYQWFKASEVVQKMNSDPLDFAVFGQTADKLFYLVYDFANPGQKWQSPDFVNWSEVKVEMDKPVEVEENTLDAEKICSEKSVIYLYIQASGCFMIVIKDPNTLEFSKWSENSKGFVPYHTIKTDRELADIYSVSNEEAKLIRVEKNGKVAIRVDMAKPDIPKITEVVFIEDMQVLDPDGFVYSMIGDFAVRNRAEDAIRLLESGFKPRLLQDSQGRYWRRTDSGFSIFDTDN